MLGNLWPTFVVRRIAVFANPIACVPESRGRPRRYFCPLSLVCRAFRNDLIASRLEHHLVGYHAQEAVLRSRVRPETPDEERLEWVCLPDGAWRRLEMVHDDTFYRGFIYHHGGDYYYT